MCISNELIKNSIQKFRNSSAGDESILNILSAIQNDLIFDKNHLPCVAITINCVIDVFKEYYLQNDGDGTTQEIIINLCSDIIGRNSDKVFELMFEE